MRLQLLTLPTNAAHCDSRQQERDKETQRESPGNGHFQQGMKPAALSLLLYLMHAYILRCHGWLRDMPGRNAHKFGPHIQSKYRAGKSALA
ncbi:MAG: hypothetical protein NVS3B14_01140 [Ktedonobacteraceae bacterium]